MITLIPAAMAIFLHILLRGVDLAGTASDYDEVTENEEKEKREEIEKKKEEIAEDLRSIASAGHV